MRYLTIAPDYTGSCIRDDFSGSIDLSDLGLPNKLIQKIELWHSLYRKIIPMEHFERMQNIKEIERLDDQGLKIAEEIAQLIPGGAKVRYFSEGRLKYLSK